MTPPELGRAPAFERAPETAGVIFIEQNGEGPGVRLWKVLTE